MAKDSGFWDNPFGGVFDIDGDGKEDFFEQALAYKILEECTKDDEDNGHSSSFDAFFDLDFDSSADASWRDYCEDGSEYGLNPEDYETEEEYEEALQNAKEEWRDYCEDGSEFGLDPKDYESEEDYEAALTEARENAWRQTCEDGSEYGLDPEDYETEEEYEEALQKAKVAWRDSCEDGSDFDLDPEDYDTEEEYEEALKEARMSPDAYLYTDSLQSSDEYSTIDKQDEIKESDYPNKRRYNAACALADEFLYCGDDEYDQRVRACCRFIAEKADTVLAANYLTHDANFLYAQAVKDHFTLPVSLPDEDETREYEFTQVLCKIAKRDILLSFEVWSWCLEQFLPYAQCDGTAADDLTNEVIDDLYSYPAGYGTEIVRHMDKYPDFRQKVMEASSKPADDLAKLIVTAIEDGLLQTAQSLYESGLKRAGQNWKAIIHLTKETIDWCRNYEELESIEYFKKTLFPLVKAIPMGMVQDEIEEWDNTIDEYISYVEDSCEQYAYTRKNAWRKTVPDGSEYDLDPCDYASAQEYMEALNEEKYGWRRWYKDDDTLGLDVNDFETQEAYEEAHDALLNEKHRKEREERERERQQRKPARTYDETDLNDKTIYTVCGVAFSHTAQSYHYRTEDPTIKIGDTVIVPVGEKEAKGTVVSVGQYMRQAAPFPIEKMKHIKHKIVSNGDEKSMMDKRS